MPRRAARPPPRKPGGIVDDLRASKMGKAADLAAQAVHETLTSYGFPDIHWRKIRINNPQERIMKEIRRRTRVVGASRKIRANNGCSSTFVSFL
jgi:transposase-like protein